MAYRDDNNSVEDHLNELKQLIEPKIDIIEGDKNNEEERPT